jgi:hypothetical protein
MHEIQSGILSEIIQVYDAALKAGIPPEQVVVSLSSHGLMRLMDTSDLSADGTKVLNSVQLTCNDAQLSDVALAPRVRQA